MDRPSPEPADHAEDFAHRYERELDQACGIIMEEVGIPADRIGARDIGRSWRNFFPAEREGGGLAPGGCISLDSGVLNPNRMAHLGPKACHAWAHARLVDRIKTCVAHEDMEYRTGSHAAAVE